MKSPKRKSMKVGILGYYGKNNLGDEAILSNILDGLQLSKIDYDPVVFSSDPSLTEALHNVKSLPSILPGNLSQLVVRALGRNRSQFFHVVKICQSLDFLLVGGGGLFFDTPVSNIFLLELLGKISFVQRLGVPVVLFGVGIGPLSMSSSIKIFEKILRRVQLIVLRDNGSLDTLKRVSASPSATFVTRDLAFCTKSDGRADELLLKENVNLDSRPILAVFLHGEEGVLSDSSLKIIRDALQKFQAAYHCTIWFLPMQIDDRIDDRVPVTKIVCADWIAFQGSYPCSTVVDLLSKVTLTLSVRLHGSILSCCAGTPTVGISYAQKVVDFYSSIGAVDRQISLQGLNEDKLFGLLSEFWLQSKSSLPVEKYAADAMSSFDLLDRFSQSLIV